MTLGLAAWLDIPKNHADRGLIAELANVAAELYGPPQDHFSQANL
jgi:hypothetical protein